MVKQTGAARMIEAIRATQNQFLKMTSDERLEFINRYEFLQPYQTTALIQCKKFMTTAERKALKQVQEKIKAKHEAQNPPQMS